MTQQIPLPTQIIGISIRVAGDLSIQGSDSPQIVVIGDSDDVTIVMEDTLAKVTSGHDCALSVPAGLNVKIEQVGGDAAIRHMSGSVNVDQVGGDLSVANLASLQLKAVGGDCAVHGVQADVSIGRIGGDLAVVQVGGILQMRKCGGDFTARDVTGSIFFETTNGDLTLSDARGGVQGSVGGDARLSFASGLEQNTMINAGGDISCALPAQIDAAFRLGSSGRRIHINMGSRSEHLRSMLHQFTIGPGKIQITLNAGGDIELTAPLDLGGSPSAWQEPGPVAPDQFKAEIDETVRQSLRGAHMSEEMAVRMEQKARKAVERARQRIEDAWRRMDFSGVPSEPFPGWPQPPAAPPPVPPQSPEEPVDDAAAAGQPVNEPVSDEERLAVLRMVQEKKITIEQAEQLLEALDAQDLDS